MDIHTICASVHTQNENFLHKHTLACFSKFSLRIKKQKRMKNNKKNNKKKQQSVIDSVPDVKGNFSSPSP